MHTPAAQLPSPPFLAAEVAARVPSPALLIDRGRVQRNIARLGELLGGFTRLRTHVKTHKCTEIYKLQLAAGITKAKAATLAEVEMVVGAGGRDVLLAYPLLGPNIELAVAFARSHPQVRFAALADDHEAVRALDAEAARQGVRFNLYVDINAGMDRTGIALGAPAAQLARAIHTAPHLRLAGLHMYDGHIAGDFATARAGMQAPYEALRRLIDDLRAGGCPVDNVITAGSPTFLPAARHWEIVNEVSPGTWVFWDTTYSDMMPDLFEIALCVLGRVISRPTPEVMTLDTGSKALSVDTGKPNCRLLGLPDAEILGWSEEHLRVRLPPGHGHVRPGTVFYLLPRHVCTTVALYDEALIVEDGALLDCWPIDARRRQPLAGVLARPPAGGLKRRTFLKGSALAAAGLLMADAWQALAARPAAAARLAFSTDYGELRPTVDRNTGLPLLLLPEGFRYTTFGWTRDPLLGGLPTPPAHDGMAVVAAYGKWVVLVRNHELRGVGFSFALPHLTYDPAAPGGTTNLVFDTQRGRWLTSWASLGGTNTNCAGGATPWGSWLSCEETLGDPGTTPLLTRTHGWVFEVPAVRRAAPEPLKAMGRFVHEAVAVDPATGIVYETEDRGTAGFYRFLPHHGGQLHRGGRLQMLGVVGAPQLDLSTGVEAGATYEVEWFDIDDPERAHVDPERGDGLGVYTQGLAKGGATFRRLEGCAYSHGVVYFVSTSGGTAGAGQVWAYDPAAARLRLLFVSPDRQVLDGPDNLTVSPRGGIVLCEDGSRRGQRLMGLTPAGELFPLAQNNVVLRGEKNSLRGDFRAMEWAGATFSPDGRWLFANIQIPGLTCAITGPWHRGPL